jgi:hypothetical protein
MNNPLIEYIKNYQLNDKFPDYEIYKWGSYGNPLSHKPGDFDLVFVGPVNRDLHFELCRFYPLAQDCDRLFVEGELDITVLPNKKLFNHIKRFNECKDDKYIFDEEIIRYKLVDYDEELQSNALGGREVEICYDLGGFTKVTQIFANKEKYQFRDWPEPILLEDFLSGEKIY